MAFAIDVLDPSARAREKQASRDADAGRLASGNASHDDLSRENGFFSSLPVQDFRIVAIGKKRLKRAA